MSSNYLNINRLVEIEGIQNIERRAVLLPEPGTFRGLGRAKDAGL
jgi:hypothetical protein